MEAAGGTDSVDLGGHMNFAERAVGDAGFAVGFAAGFAAGFVVGFVVGHHIQIVDHIDCIDCIDCIALSGSAVDCELGADAVDTGAGNRHGYRNHSCTEGHQCIVHRSGLSLRLS